MIKNFLRKLSGTSQDDEKRKVHEQGALLLHARELDITMSNVKQLWKWLSVSEKSLIADFMEPNIYKAIRHASASFEVAELLEIRFFEVRGSFDCTDLVPETKYEVMLLMKMKPSSCQWLWPVKLELALPSGQKSEYQKKFSEIPQTKDKWFELKIGEFWTPQPGKVEFSVKNTDIFWSKKGLLIKGVLVRPVAGSND